MRSRFRVYLTGVLTGFCAGAVLHGSVASAAPVYQPPGANLTFGDVTHGLRALSAAGNPAAAAADLARTEAGVNAQGGGLVFSAVAGIEFGNVDEFYATIDRLANEINPSPNPNPDPPPTEESPVERPGFDLGDLIEICCPDLNDLIGRIEREVKNRIALLTLIQVDAYAKAFQSLDMPVLLGSEVAGGALTFAANWSGSTKAYSFVDPNIVFDPDAALADLTAQYGLMDGDPLTTFDIAGDVDIIVDPSTGRVAAVIDNDSTLVTKAVQTTELSIGYSRQIGEQGGRGLFVGGELSYYDLKLSRLSYRFGDITDTEELFKSIGDADYIGDSGFGLDVGVLWVGEQSQFGLTIANINEPTYYYPDVDLSAYSEPGVVDRLLRDRSYTMERQLKLEASLFTPDRRWTANFGIDANETEDPMGDDFQWLTVSGGWARDNSWVRNARLGYRRNLAGTKLDYFSAGLTAFKWFNIDLAVELDRVEIKDDKTPRGAILSLGFQVDF